MLNRTEAVPDRRHKFCSPPASFQHCLQHAQMALTNPGNPLCPWRGLGIHSVCTCRRATLGGLCAAACAHITHAGIQHLNEQIRDFSPTLILLLVLLSAYGLYRLPHYSVYICSGYITEIALHRLHYTSYYIGSSII